ncbi:MAG TPA: porin family protein [Telluria sp.]|jgi:OOP family OmpA-OmpF porin
MKKIIFACIMATAFVAPAHAEGTYVGLGVTTTSHSSYESDTKGALKLFGGYDFTPTWGIEAGYMDIPSFKTNYAFSSMSGEGVGLTYSGETHGKAMYIAGKATMAISDKFALVTKLGIGHERVHQTYTAPGSVYQHTVMTNELYAGIGLKYSLSEKTALTLELERLGSTSRYNSGIRPEKVSLNASYRF